MSSPTKYYFASYDLLTERARVNRKLQELKHHYGATEYPPSSFFPKYLSHLSKHVDRINKLVDEQLSDGPMVRRIARLRHAVFGYRLNELISMARLEIDEMTIMRRDNDAQNADAARATVEDLVVVA